MPTNKLWIEHTEKAAWDSVQALRDKIADAERRIERLGPPVAAWQPLLDELDRARGELGLQDVDYVEVLRLLLERAARDKARLEELEREREKPVQRGEQPFDVTALMQHRHHSFDDDDDGLASSHRASQLEHDLERRRRELVADRALPDDVDALLRLVDAKVADLGEVEGSALSDAALDLGVYALALTGARDED